MRFTCSALSALSALSAFSVLSFSGFLGSSLKMIAGATGRMNPATTDASIAFVFVVVAVVAVVVVVEEFFEVDCPILQTRLIINQRLLLPHSHGVHPLFFLLRFSVILHDVCLQEKRVPLRVVAVLQLYQMRMIRRLPFYSIYRKNGG